MNKDVERAKSGQPFINIEPPRVQYVRCKRCGLIMPVSQSEQHLKECPKKYDF